MRYIVAMVIAAGGLIGPAEGLALEPEEIALVVRRDDAMGLRLARYYCETRGVPREQIVVVNLPEVEEIPWRAYEERIVAPVRAHLKRRDIVAKVRCLLLVGHMPLKVTPDPATEAEKSELAKLRAYRKQAELEYYQQGWRAEQIALGQMPGEPPEKVPSKELRHFWDIDKYYQGSVKRAENTVENLPEKEAKRLGAKLAEIRAAVEGLAALEGDEPDDVIAADFKERHAQWQANKKKLDEAREELAELAGKHGPAALRDRRRRLLLEKFGLRGALNRVIGDQYELSSGSRSSSVDSELALLWRDNYGRHGSQGNPLHGSGISATPGKPGQPPAAVMTARLDGADLARTIKTIDEGITVEKLGTGIIGKFCIDAIGLPETDRNSRYDNELVRLAQWSGRPEKMPLVKDASIRVLPPPTANDVGLYFGWTRDATLPEGYRCATGAVAVNYNDDSVEGLHDAGSTRPAGRWLAAGAVAVVGIVDRGGFYAIPSPDDLAGALIRDHLPLAEAYWTTCDRTSWRGVLLGDPLYRPFPPAGN